MVERVADVLARLPVRDASDPGGELDTLRRLEAARAVIDALMEPTPEMLTEGAFPFQQHRYGPTMNAREAAAAIYRAMLSKAKEGTGE